MATKAASPGPSMKLQIYVDKKNNRVVFAEANNDFVDFIFHILSLPLAAVHRILAKNTSTSLGSLGTLQEGLKNLDAKYITPLAKDYLLDLKAPYWGRNTTLLLPEASCSYPTELYKCSIEQDVSLDACDCLYGHRNVDIFPTCLEQILFQRTNARLTGVLGNENGYVKEAATFIVMDDLVVRLAGPASVFSVMNQLSIKDVGAFERKEVTFDTAQAVKLLKASLSSKTVLTDVFLGGPAVKAEN